MPANEFDETLFPQVAIGSKVVVWCLEFPPERRGDKICTRLLEEVEIEIVDIERRNHRSGPQPATLAAKIKAFVKRLTVRQDGKSLQKPFRYVLGRDAAGREFHTCIAMQFAKKNRLEPVFIVLASIIKGGGSPEWWTPAYFRRSGWHLLEDET